MEKTRKQKAKEWWQKYGEAVVIGLAIGGAAAIGVTFGWYKRGEVDCAILKKHLDTIEENTTYLPK